jgi:tRNA A-37 threonylcarbamoyl transferase component Bud32
LNGDWRVPGDFRVVESGETRLIVHEQLQESFTREGFDQPAVWESCLGTGVGESGRGANAIRSFGEVTLRLKQLRRGGLASRYRREHFSADRRLLENLSLPLEVAARGIPTAKPWALLVESVTGSGYRGWLATEELSSMRDAAAGVREATQESEARWLVTMGVIKRMHDAGVEHRDLNLGNLLIGDEPQRPVAVVDFDNARLHDDPLPFGLRQQALRRLERSYVKTCYPRAAAEAVRTQIYSRYAADDLPLTRRLRRGRRIGRWAIALHRLGWSAG